MSDIRGIHYEISKPKLNDTDGYYYQRRRQVDGQGNLVGIGDERIQLPKPNSLDGQYQRDIDWSKLGKLGGDFGQIGIGALKRDPRMITNGAVSFGKDIQNGVFRDYDSWPGTDKPWENGDIPAPSRDFTTPDDGSKQPASPHTENFPIRRLVRLTNASPAVSAAQADNIGSSANGTGDIGASPTSSSQNPQGPLSVNDAYLLYLKRLGVNQPQASSFGANASSPPLAPSDDADFSGGLPGRLAAIWASLHRSWGQFLLPANQAS